MLAAATKSSGPLGLVRLILSLVQNGGQPIPEQLKDHLLVVVQQARTIAANPADIGNQALPEAIELALEIKSADVLKDELDQVTNFQSINADLARRLLDRLGGDALPQA